MTVAELIRALLDRPLDANVSFTDIHGNDAVRVKITTSRNRKHVTITLVY